MKVRKQKTSIQFVTSAIGDSDVPRVDVTAVQSVPSRIVASPAIKCTYARLKCDHEQADEEATRRISQPIHHAAWSGSLA